MAYHGVMIPSKVSAKVNDALVRYFKASVALDNGNVIFLNSGISATAGEGEVWTASTPTSTTVTGVWMVGEPEVVMTGNYKGLDPDVRNFYTPAGEIATAFKVKKYDVVRLTVDNFSNTRTNEGYVGIGASGAKLTWQASSSNALFKFVETTTIPLSAGSPGNNRIVAYRIEAIDE